MPPKGHRGPVRHAEALMADCEALVELLSQQARSQARDARTVRLATGIRCRAQAFLQEKRRWARQQVVTHAAKRAATETRLRSENRLLRRLLAIKTLGGIEALKPPIDDAVKARGLSRN